MKKRIFRRIFFIYAIVMLLAILFTEIYVTSAVRNSYINNLERNLLVQIDLVSNSITFNQVNIDSLCKQLKVRTGARITVIDNDGKVVGDSDTDSSLMDNHINRTEIEQSLLYGTGASIRYSDTLRYDFLYIAKKTLKGENPQGFVRLAVPLKEIDHAVNLLRIKIILVVSLILLATGIFSIWQTDYLRRLLKQITDFSRSLARGEIDKRLFLKNAGEFDEIAGNLTAMSVKLQSMISQIEEEKNRLNAILRSIPDALLIIDSKGIVLLSSSASRKFFGAAPIRERPFIEIVRNHEFLSLMDNVRKNLISGVTEFRLDYPEERHIVVRVSPLFYKESELSGFVAIFHDITQLKKLEQMRKDFVANVSHEIKTPITAIKGFAETLMAGAIDDRENALRFLQTIKNHSERLNSLVEDLLTLSRIELGDIKIEKTAVSLDDIINTVFTTLRNKAEIKGIYLKKEIPENLGEIKADRNRLTQILLNLVDNGIKFTETGGVTVRVKSDSELLTLNSQFLNLIEISVEDTGIGIPQKHLPRLGERFYRVDSSRSRELGGTGLGLAIVKHLVKAHGWEMKIESTPGKGTKVHLICPLS